jgi:hypothetical protein
LGGGRDHARIQADPADLQTEKAGVDNRLKMNFAMDPAQYFDVDDNIGVADGALRHRCSEAMRIFPV